jgi:predicted CXXCH cytochrome family protein
MQTTRRMSGRTIIAALVFLALAGITVSAICRPSRAAAAAAAEAKDAAPAEQPRYVGMKACLACHAKVAEGWADAGHGKALSDPALPEDELGCEACHGPGSIHVGSLGKKQIPEPCQDVAKGEAVCAKCHLREEGSKLPEAWPNLRSRHWQRTLHARQGTSCLSCHQVHGGAPRALKQAPEELCLSCHKAVVNDQEGGFTHDPVAKGQCLLCHLPHGGAARHNLVDKPATACLKCHPAGEALQKPHSQYAVAEADCLSCHNPHSFDRERKLVRKSEHQPFAERKCEICHLPSEGSAAPALIKPQKQLCLGCHPAEKIMPAKRPDGRPMVQHPPVEQGLCTTCHNPHASDHGKLVKDRLDYACFLCHGKIEDATLQPKQHKPVATGNCLLCHQAHVSAEPKLLTKPPVDACQPCHGTQMKFSHPVGMRDGKPVLDPNTKQMLVCARCHAVHGSKLDNLMPREVDDLCRECHKH